jgi:hypothetical protein
MIKRYIYNVLLIERKCQPMKKCKLILLKYRRKRQKSCFYVNMTILEICGKWFCKGVSIELHMKTK